MNWTHALLTLSFTCILSLAASVAVGKDTRLYEMRTYYARQGKLNALNARFRDHTAKLFEKHGMTNVGYWTPIDNPSNKLIYILAYPDRDAREKSWKAFQADPEWQKVKTESESSGPLLANVEQLFLTATDYSPEIQPSTAEDRVFELRTYTATPGNLDNLNSRFRDHTVKLFQKHGITNIGYWVLAEGERNSDKMLIYIIAHKTREAADASFDAFRKDPDWVAARKASEEKGGGSLTIAEGGVKSLFMKATDYSPIR